MTPPEDPPAIVGVLSGDEGADGVRRVVTDPLQHGVQPQLAAQGLTPTAWRTELLRTKLKPSRKLSAEYRLTPAAGPNPPRYAAVAWTLDPGGVRVALSVSPADPAMPQLARLVTPGHVADLVGTVTGRSPRVGPDSRVTTVRYRPGQRHVLLFEPGDRGAAVYVKTDRDCSGARAVEVAEVIREAFALRYPAARTAQPLGWVAEDLAAFWWRADGASLSRILTDHPSGSSSAVWRVGRALRVIHGASMAGATGTPRVRPVPLAEARISVRAGTHLHRLLPEVGTTYASLLSDALERLERLPEEPAVLAHGDFKCDNILFHDGCPRILDLDRACRAEPAYDLGRFLADLAWWRPGPRGQAELADAFRAGYGPCDHLRWQRAEAWAVLFRLRNVARRCPLHDPSWATQVRTLVHATAAASTAVEGA